MAQAFTEQAHNRGALRAKSAAVFIGIAESTFWRWVAAGKLPKGKKLSPKVTVWMQADLQSFLDGAK